MATKKKSKKGFFSRNVNTETDSSPMAEFKPFIEESKEDTQKLAIEVGNYRDEKFEETYSEYIDELEYPRNGTNQGLVIIFNQENFANSKKRRGTRKDVEALIITLGRLKFNIEEQYIFNDLSRQNIMIEIDKICNIDHSNVNSLICVFLSHGEAENKIVTNDDSHVTIDEIYLPFCKCESLQGKPKLFLFQACKNKPVDEDEIDTVAATLEDDSELVYGKTLGANIPPDLLLVFTTLEGKVSFRNIEEGSWFIQELCRNLTAYGRRDDVASLIIRTTKCVAYNYSHVTDKILYKQMPLFISTLKKKFYLIKSKEREFMLKILKENMEFKKSFEEVNKKLDDIMKLLKM